MQEHNISYIFLLGFPNLNKFNSSLFLFLLLIYCLTVWGNVFIILLVSLSKTLHSPMYFFITLISFLDIVLTTNIVPNFLHIALHDSATMSLAACFSQLYVFGNSETSECLILALMSYDRYVAICNPLRYSSIITKAFSVRSVIASWFLSFLLILIIVIDIYKLDFCGPNVIDHFFCDFHPLIELSCTDTSLVQMKVSLFGIILVICPLTMIIVSYLNIISTILNIRSISGRQKAFSTCSSHLTVVCIFFGTLFSVYMVPNKVQSVAISKVLSLIYTIVTPLLNPFIYSLRNKEFKRAFEKSKHTGI